MKITEFDMSVRLWNILNAIGVRGWTSREVADYEANEWLRFRNIGRKSHWELKEIVYEAGLSFGKKRFENDMCGNPIVRKG